MTALKTNFDIVDIVFKIDAITNTNVVFSDGKSEVRRDDLRDPHVLVDLTKKYYGDAVTLTDAEWGEVHDTVSKYVTDACDGDTVARNVKWSLKSLEFDNTYGYGEKNFIDFSKLTGIVGLFAPNRSGKSSILGTLAYSLFNTSDRGSVKNINIVNERKAYCSAKTLLNVGGHDYLIERQTTKHESKKGHISAPTALNFFEVDEAGEVVRDLAGEARMDTDKFVKTKIGSAEDFFMTSVSSQGGINTFIDAGSTKRRQTLSKFLDIDIFDKMYELAKKDLSYLNGQIKQLTPVTVEDIETYETRLVQARERLIETHTEHQQVVQKMDDVKLEAAKLSKPVVTDAQFKQQRQRVDAIEKNIDASERLIRSGNEDIQKYYDKLRKIALLKSEHDIGQLREFVTRLHVSESDIRTVKQELDKEKSLLKQQRKSLVILNEVPCGDEYPTCKFIADAHTNKGLIQGQTYVVEGLLTKVEKMEVEFESLRAADYKSQLEKLEQLQERETSLRLNITKSEAEVARSVSMLEKLKSDLVVARKKLEEFEAASSDDENAYANSLRDRILAFQGEIDAIDVKKTKIASEMGRLEHALEQKRNDMTTRDELFKEMKLYEVITNAFSKKGLPNLIVNSQLPVINEKIARILRGTVDFDIELEVDDSDFLEVYIDYGDSRRPIEMCSGMEKMIASMAIRVALIEVSTLPKSDMLIIDEGFGTLDVSGIEMCNNVLMLLKEHFRLIVIITHVDGIKDVADTTLEITKKELDSHIVYEGE